MLDVKRLRVLRDVAQQGSMSGAAMKLGFSPSAVSQQIAQLERELGVTLVERRPTGTVLTAAGGVLAGHATAILARAADAEAELRQLSNGGLGNLRIAAFSTAAAVVMPEAIVEFQALQPCVELELVEQDRDVSLDQIRCGELDLAVVVRSPDPQSEAGVLMTQLLDDVIDVALPSSHKLANASEVELEQLRDEAWADCSGRPVYHHLSALGIVPRVVFRSYHPRVIEHVVAAGSAVAFMPRLAQPVAHNGVVVRPLARDAPVRRVGIAIRDDEPRSLSIKTMVEVLCRVAARATDTHRINGEEARKIALLSRL